MTDDAIRKTITMIEKEPPRRYFNGDLNEPQQWHCYKCSCGRWLKVQSAKHWTRTNWQHSACNGCGKRVNLNMKKIVIQNTKGDAKSFLFWMSAIGRMNVLEKALRARYNVTDEKGKVSSVFNKCPPLMWEEYTDEMIIGNRQMWEDLNRIENSKHREFLLLSYIEWKLHSAGKDKVLVWVLKKCGDPDLSQHDQRRPFIMEHFKERDFNGWDLL